MLTFYVILATILLGIIAYGWVKTDPTNHFIKICMNCIFIFGIIVSLSQLGYIVKI